MVEGGTLGYKAISPEIEGPMYARMLGYSLTEDATRMLSRAKRVQGYSIKDLLEAAITIKKDSSDFIGLQDRSDKPMDDKIITESDIHLGFRLILFPRITLGKKYDAPKGDDYMVDDDIMAKFKWLTVELSPENLSCDGELSRSQVAKKRASIMREWHAMERKYGIKMSVSEVEDWSMRKYLEKSKYGTDDSYEDFFGSEEGMVYAAPTSSLPAGVTKKRICDNCKHFRAKNRECTKLNITNVDAGMAEKCYFYDYRPTRTPTGRPKPPKDWWYANHARFLCTNRKDPHYTGSIVGSLWYHKLNDERIAEKIGLWGSDAEIESARNAGWDVPEYEDHQKNAERERIRAEIVDGLESLQDDPRGAELVAEAVRDYNKVWSPISPPTPAKPSKPKANFCPNCGAKVTGFTCKCGQVLNAPATHCQNALDLMSEKFK